MRDEKEGRKKEASKVKQTTRQSNTAHPRQSLFLKNELPRVGLDVYTCSAVEGKIFVMQSTHMYIHHHKV